MACSATALDPPSMAFTTLLICSASMDSQKDSIREVMMPRVGRMRRRWSSLMEGVVVWRTI